MEKPILAIFDSEEKYVYGLMEFLSSKPNLPFQIHVFTEKDKFFQYSKKEEMEYLLISERVYQKEVEALPISHIIVLSENKDAMNATLAHIYKYQSCETIYKELLEYYSNSAEATNHILRNKNQKMKIIGIYTPIGRCLQTTFSIALGQLLAKRARVLYLNFERYSGLSSMLHRNFKNDLSDFMYYFQCAKEKMSLRLESMVETVNGLDFIPPVEIYQNLLGIQGKQWMELFYEMEKNSDYDYLILDLADELMDLWEILRNCSLVYTITRGDGMAMAKMEQYEKALHFMEYEDVLIKTKKLQFPIFRELPMHFEELTYGELAAYLKKNILPEIMGGQEDVP